VFTLILILKKPFVVKNLKKITNIADTDNGRDACNNVVGSDDECSTVIFCGVVVRVERVMRAVTSEEYDSEENEIFKLRNRDPISYKYISSCTAFACLV